MNFRNFFMLLVKNFLGYYSLCYFLTIIHEFAHAYVAKILDVKVKALNIGSGKILFHSKKFIFPVTLCAFPFGGKIFFNATYYHKTPAIFKLLIYMAGPFSSIFLQLLSCMLAQLRAKTVFAA